MTFGKRIISPEKITTRQSPVGSGSLSRLQNFDSGYLGIFVSTRQRFQADRCRFVHALHLSDDTRTIIRATRQFAQNLYQEGHAYLKAGVGLIELVDRNHCQQDLFDSGQPESAGRLMHAIDSINSVAGNGSAFFAAQGVSKPWYIRKQFTSPQ